MPTKAEFTGLVNPSAETPKKVYENLGVFISTEPDCFPVPEARRNDWVGVRQVIRTGFDILKDKCYVRILPLDALSGLSTAGASEEEVDYWYELIDEGKLAFLHGTNSGRLELNDQNAAAKKS